MPRSVWNPNQVCIYTYHADYIVIERYDCACCCSVVSSAHYHSRLYLVLDLHQCLSIPTCVTSTIIPKVVDLLKTHEPVLVLHTFKHHWYWYSNPFLCNLIYGQAWLATTGDYLINNYILGKTINYDKMTFWVWSVTSFLTLTFLTVGHYMVVGHY